MYMYTKKEVLCWAVCFCCPYSFVSEKISQKFSSAVSNEVILERRGGGLELLLDEKSVLSSKVCPLLLVRCWSSILICICKCCVFSCKEFSLESKRSCNSVRKSLISLRASSRLVVNDATLWRASSRLLVNATMLSLARCNSNIPVVRLRFLVESAWYSCWWALSVIGVWLPSGLKLVAEVVEGVVEVVVEEEEEDEDESSRKNGSFLLDLTRVVEVMIVELPWVNRSANFWFSTFLDTSKIR